MSCKFLKDILGQLNAKEREQLFCEHKAIFFLEKLKRLLLVGEEVYELAN